MLYVRAPLVATLLHMSFEFVASFVWAPPVATQCSVLSYVHVPERRWAVAGRPDGLLKALCLCIDLTDTYGTADHTRLKRTAIRYRTSIFFDVISDQSWTIEKALEGARYVRSQLQDGKPN